MEIHGIKYSPHIQKICFTLPYLKFINSATAKITVTSPQAIMILIGCLATIMPHLEEIDVCYLDAFGSNVLYYGQQYVRGSDLLSAKFPFFPFLFTNHVSRNEDRNIFQKIIKTSHILLPIIQCLDSRSFLLQTFPSYIQTIASFKVVKKYPSCLPRKVCVQPLDDYVR